MNRRRFLRRTAVPGVAVLAGCVSTGDDDAPTRSDIPPETRGSALPAPATQSTPSDSPPGSQSTTDPPPSSPTTGRPVAGATFRTRNAACGTGENVARVRFDGAADEVRVVGTIPGSDACATAALDGVRYDGADELVVVVRTVRDPSVGETAACAECLLDIDYVATVRLASALPARVVVTHDGDVVTTADRRG